MVPKSLKFVKITIKEDSKLQSRIIAEGSIDAHKGDLSKINFEFLKALTEVQQSSQTLDGFSTVRGRFTLDQAESLICEANSENKENAIDPMDDTICLDKNSNLVHFNQDCTEIFQQITINQPNKKTFKKKDQQFVNVNNSYLNYNCSMSPTKSIGNRDLMGSYYLTDI